MVPQQTSAVAEQLRAMGVVGGAQIVDRIESEAGLSRRRDGVRSTQHEQDSRSLRCSRLRATEKELEFDHAGVVDRDEAG